MNKVTASYAASDLRISGTTSDAEALQISKKVLSILAADLQSQNEIGRYAHSVIQRVLGPQEK